MGIFRLYEEKFTNFKKNHKRFKKLKMRKILFLAFMILWVNSWASHFSGGWIEAQVINSNTIKVKLKLITDCAGISLGSTESVNVSAIPGPIAMPSTQFTLNLISSIKIENYCDSLSSTCYGGFQTGFKLWTYEGVILIPSSISNSVRIYYQTCCRAVYINNLVPTYNYAIYTDIFSLNSVQNNSPSKYSYDIFSSANDTSVISYSFTDLESDSLSYQLSTPVETANPIILNPFSAGYSASHPLGTNLYSNLNGGTGTYEFKSPSAQGIYSVAFNLNEYRNGQKLSVINGEQVIFSKAINTNGIFNFGATGDSYKAFEPCNADTITYNVSFNLNDSIVVNVDSLGSYTGATFNVTNISPTQKQATFIWQPDYSAITMNPDKVVFHVTKFACPYKKVLTYTTIYNVNSCPSDSVWPGDINLDKTVNLIDGIYLAAAYNDNGAPRANPSINWMPQYALDWTNSFNSGGNHKHADGDGNGTVNILDALAIAQNFNLTHAKVAGNNYSKISSTIYDPTITFGTPSFTGTNTIVNMPVSIGDVTKKVLGTNAVLFRIDADPAFIEGNTLQFIPNAGIITNTNDIVITQYKDVANSDLYIAFVKKNNGSFSGNGLLGQFNFKVKATAPIGSTNLYISNERLFGPKMLPQSVLGGPFKTLNIVLGLKQFGQLSNISITPNPFQNNFAVGNDKPISTYEIMDMTGKIILKKNVNTNNFNVNTENLNSGIYFIKMFVEGKAIVSKMVKE
jgi:hypothetical protein